MTKNQLTRSMMLLSYCDDDDIIESITDHLQCHDCPLNKMCSYNNDYDEDETEKRGAIYGESCEEIVKHFVRYGI